MNRGRLCGLMPFLLLISLAGSVLFVTNPGLFWDDWVWVGQDSATRIVTGRELGVWWAGYLSNFIFSLPHPILTLRVVALVGWLVGAVAFTSVLRREDVVTLPEGILLFGLLNSCPIAMIRVIASLAMYNVYIACFWLAFAILPAGRKGPWRAGLAVVLLAFSFHLNSLLPLFVPVAGYFALKRFAFDLRKSWIEFRSGILGLRRTASPPGDAAFTRSLLEILSDIPELVRPAGRLVAGNWFLLAPVVFIAVVRVPTAILNTVHPQSTSYIAYNKVQINDVLVAPFRIIPTFASFLFGYLNQVVRLTGVPDLGVILIAVVSALPLLALAQRVGLRRSGGQILVGLVLFAAAVLPYFFVGKPPVVKDFYEERNVLPALPGLLLVLLGLLNLAALATSKAVGSELAGVLRNLAAVALIGSALYRQLAIGADLATDWRKQRAIADLFAAEREYISRFSTVIVDDQTENAAIFHRKIWAYEYIGRLRDFFPNRDILFVPIAEYISWPGYVPLLYDVQLHSEFGIEHYDPRGRQLLVTIRNLAQGEQAGGSDRCEALRASASWILPMPGAGGCTREFPIKADIKVIETEAAQRLYQMTALARSIEDFRKEYGYYPYTTRDRPTLSEPGGQQVGSALEGYWPVPSTANSVPGLDASGILGTEPSSLPVAPRDSPQDKNLAPRSVVKDCINAGCRFLYMSDGLDYKIVFLGAADFLYASHAFPRSVDPRRRGYGVWTSGAGAW